MQAFSKLAVLACALTTSLAAPLTPGPVEPAGTVAAAGAVSLKSTSWNPPSVLTNALASTWTHQMNTYQPKDPVHNFHNYGYQQVIANDGKLNFCVRWDSSKTVDAATRANIEVALNRQVKHWNDVLVGFEGWPYKTVPVKVTGWATRNNALLTGYDASKEGFKIYNDKDSGGIPECSEACGRFFHQDNDYSKCPGGAANHYDMSLWLTDSFNNQGTVRALDSHLMSD
jgi:hypothetical protein